MSPAEVPREVGAGSSSGPDLESEHADDDESWKPDMLRRVSRKVVPGLPRAQTFKRQQSEKRTNLAPVQPTPDERRAVSVDRRVQQARATSQPTSQQRSFPRASAPELLENACDLQSAPSAHTSSVGEYAEYSLANVLDVDYSEANPPSIHEVDAGPDPLDNRSITTSQYDDMIHDELERKWILNLSMHFRDKSKREKFFVTYRENESVWRRVTVSLDYRNAPDNSLELDLSATRFQRDKSAKIYEAIRESLQDIQFYDSVTNLKLQTTDGRLHVHVVEDTNVSAIEAHLAAPHTNHKLRRSSITHQFAKYNIWAAAEYERAKLNSTPICLASCTGSESPAKHSSRRRFQGQRLSMSFSTRSMPSIA